MFELWIPGFFPDVRMMAKHWLESMGNDPSNRNKAKKYAKICLTIKTKIKNQIKKITKDDTNEKHESRTR